MSTTISEAAAEFDEACMVTGEAHHAAVAQLLEANDPVEVLNPEPENLSWETRIALTLMKPFDRWHRRE